MHKITLIGWSSSDQAVVEKVTYWPEEMTRELAIAKAAQVTDLMIFEEVLVEEVETGTIPIIVNKDDEGNEPPSLDSLPPKP